MVFRSMKRRDVVRALRKTGCTVQRDTGGHTVYACPCGAHEAPLPRHSEISAGVVKSIGDQMACLTKGWLQ